MVFMLVPIQIRSWDSNNKNKSQHTAPFLLILPVFFVFLPFHLPLTVDLEFSVRVYVNPKKIHQQKQGNVKKIKFIRIYFKGQLLASKIKLP